MTPTNRDDLELRLTTALSPMLLTVAIFSLTLVGNIVQPAATFVDEILCLQSASCILGAAMVADSALDKAGLSISDRFVFLGGGYFFFCLAAGVMTLIIPLLYLAKTAPATHIPLWQYILYMLTSLSVITKLMQNKEEAWTVGMFLLFAATLCVIAAT